MWIEVVGLVEGERRRGNALIIQKRKNLPSDAACRERAKRNDHSGTDWQEGTLDISTHGSGVKARYGVR